MNDDNERSGPDPSGPAVGSVADEAAQLFAALGGWARQHGGEYAGAAAGAASAAEDAARNLSEHIATDGEDCRYCPVCRAISLVRSTSPEVRAHLLVAANSLVQAAAGILATEPPTGLREQVEKIDLEDPENLENVQGPRPAADPSSRDWNETP